MVTLGRTSLALLLSFTVAVTSVAPASSFAQAETSASGSAAVPSTEGMTGAEGLTGIELQRLEARLIAEIDVQADAIFNDFKATHPKAPLGFLKKTKNQIVFRLKQMGVLADYLKASGKAPALTMLAGMIVVDCVIVPILAVTGHPVAAGVVYSVPWGSFAGAGVFAYLALKTRRQIARELNVPSLKDADQLRKMLLGYNVKHRVLETILTSIDGRAREFEVLRTTLKRELLTNSTVSIEELEGLVLSHAEGKPYLDTVFMQKLHPALYAQLLLRFITSHEELVSKFVESLESRPARILSIENAQARETISIAADLRDQIQRETNKIAHLKSDLMKKRLRSGDVLGSKTKSLAVHLNSEFDRLQEIRREAALAEYSLLVSLSLKSSSSLETKIESSDRTRGLVDQWRAQLLRMKREASFVEFRKANSRLCSDTFGFAI